MYIEGSKVKKAEGIPIQEYDVPESVEDFQERKAKEEKKENKKLEKELKKEEKEKEKDDIRPPPLRRTTSVKVKGQHWFTRS